MLLVLMYWPGDGKGLVDIDIPENDGKLLPLLLPLLLTIGGIDPSAGRGPSLMRGILRGSSGLLVLLLFGEPIGAVMSTAGFCFKILCSCL